MASLDAPIPSDPAAAVPASIVDILGQTRPWVRFMSILAFVGMGLGVVAMTVAVLVARSAEALAFIPMCLVLCLYVPPAIYLGRCAGHIRRLQQGAGMPALEEALSTQKSFWKYVGILAIVMICLYAVVLVLGGLSSLLKFSRH